MNNFAGYLVVGVLLLSLILVYTIWSQDRAMEQCLQQHLPDTCHSILK